MDRLDCDRMFVAVIDAGSFALAARRLGVSSGQASKLVRKLEADLGAQLLKRTTRALAVTEVGQAYHARMKHLLEEFDSLDAAVRSVSGTPSGRLRLTAPLSFGKLKVMPLLLEFARAFPDILLDIDLSDNTRNIVDDGYDMAIRIGNPSDSSLIARKLCDVRILLVAAPSYLAGHGIPGSPGDVARHACIVDTNFRDSLNWRFRAGEGQRLRVPVSAAMRVSNGEACLAAAEAGFGLAHIPDFIARTGIAAGTVQRLLPDWEDRPVAVHALYPPARHLALKVRALVDFMAASLANE